MAAAPIIVNEKLQVSLGAVVHLLTLKMLALSLARTSTGPGVVRGLHAQRLCSLDRWTVVAKHAVGIRSVALGAFVALGIT